MPYLLLYVNIVNIGNMVDKILAFIIAFMLWGYVNMQGSVEISFTVPIYYKNQPADMVPVKGLRDEVVVKVRGNPLMLKRLRPQDIKVIVDFSNEDIKEGKNKIEIDLDNIEVPSDIKVVGVTPSVIYPVFEKVIEVAVPVRVRWKGRRPLFKWGVKPKNVLVSARRSLARRIKYVYTRRVDARKLFENKKLTVALVCENIVCDPSKVEVYLHGKTVRDRRYKGKGK